MSGVSGAVSARGLGRQPARCTGRGRVNQKVEPSPGVLSHDSSPPISWTSSREIARPRPVPPKRRVNEAVGLLEAARRCGPSRRRRSRCRCRATENRSRGRRPPGRLQRRPGHRSVNFDRVAHQVGQHLAQARTIARSPRGRRPDRSRVSSRTPFSSARRAHRAPTERVSVGQVERMVLDDHLAGLDAHRGPGCPTAAAPGCGPDRRMISTSSRALGVQLRPWPAASAPRDDAVQRRADLVAHVGQEGALGLAGLFGLVRGRRAATPWPPCWR